MLQTNYIDYTDDGDECTNKCQWYNHQNSSVYTMSCLKANGSWAQCTPFICNFYKKS